jgi:hypothetical protein
VIIAVSLVAGGTNAVCTDSIWKPTGKIRYRCVNTGTGTPEATSDYSPQGTTYAGNLQMTGLTVGYNYKLQYYLDCIPNIGGYVEEWLDVPGITWEQPHKDDPEYEGEYEA